jgi:aldehyde dehydrogenase
MRGCAGTLRYYADIGDGLSTREELPAPNGRVVVARDPMGVAALLVPWNAPARLAFLSLAPMLLAGNTVVVKPPSDAPLTLIDSIAAIADLFPAGTINVVTGPGDTVGRALVADPLVRKVNFTGSTEAGKEILQLTADTVKRVSLELGGNDPAIVLVDADLDQAVPELVRGVFGLTGQLCYGVKRIYVQAPIHDEFVEHFGVAIGKLVVGDGLDARSSMGPLINERQRERLRGLLREAEQAGGRVERGGVILDESAWPLGWFELPAMVTGVDERHAIVNCEQFGPAVPIMAFASEDEAVERANSTEFGLASSVWTRDLEHGFEVAGRIEAGTSFVNIHRLGASADDMPFGGFKQSGLGRSHGLPALEEQFELHTISSRRPG